MTKKTIKFLKIMQDIMSSGDYREVHKHDIFGYGKSKKTNGKDLKIPDLQPPD